MIFFIGMKSLLGLDLSHYIRKAMLLKPAILLVSVTVYEPYRAMPIVDSFRESGDGTYAVAMGHTNDRIMIATGKFSLARGPKSRCA
jgi:hypothetical protein